MIVEEPLRVEYKPIHGQSIERAVKQVTRACKTVYGYEARDGFIRAGIASCQLMPKKQEQERCD
jgi:hypothetical protein